MHVLNGLGFQITNIIYNKMGIIITFYVNYLIYSFELSYYCSNQYHRYIISNDLSYI